MKNLEDKIIIEGGLEKMRKEKDLSKIIKISNKEEVNMNQEEL